MGWGAWTTGKSNNSRLGIFLSVSGTTITAVYKVQFQYTASDTITLSRSGAITGNHTFTYNQSGGEYTIATNTRTGTRGSTYTFGASLSGVYNGANSSVSGQQITVPALEPNAPGAPTFSQVTATTMRVQASAPANNGSAITTYRFYWATNSAFTTGTGWTDRTSPLLDIVGLKKYTTYYFRVRARNGVGWSDYSSTRSQRTLATAPVISNNYSASSITRNSARTVGVSVTDNGGQAPTNVRVRWNTSASATGATTKTQGSWAEITMSGLAADTTYYFSMSAYNSAGWGAWGSWKSFKTLDDAPDDIGELTFTDVTDNSFRVNWDAPAMNGATFLAYYYEVSAHPSFSSLIKSGTTTGTTLYTSAGLIPGTRYYVRVRANATPNNGGYGTGDVLLTGRAPNSGMQVFGVVEGVVRPGVLYTFIDGVRKQLKPMYAHDGQMETE